ncbi:hypothetical protein Sxan_11360 [Streptomyces xanthophaeus]|uniref:Uncharacterized protein n=1 Tax=Streptomyces xanthophaeus TaxID=67385 RepID=A0A919GT37_9ACTN|nr:hypothetical protein Sxan_11360 [Streptomyces xanthophaeus]
MPGAADAAGARAARLPATNVQVIREVTVVRRLRRFMVVFLPHVGAEGEDEERRPWADAQRRDIVTGASRRRERTGRRAEPRPGTLPPAAERAAVWADP